MKENAKKYFKKRFFKKDRNSRLGKSPVSWSIFIILLICASYCLFKLLWGVMTSFKTVDQFMDDKLSLPSGWPWEWAWSNYVYTFKNFYVPVTGDMGTRRVWFEELLLNSLLFAGVGTVIQVTVPTMMAYVTAKFRYKFSEWIYMGVIIVMLIPLMGGSGATLKLFRAVGIYDTFFGFWFMKISFTNTSYLFLYAAFKGVPNDYTEAAIIDGAGEWTIFTTVNLPMVMPLVGTFLLLNFIGFWNDYMTPLIYSPSKPTIAYGVYILTNTNLQGFSRTPMRMTSAVLSAIPMIIIFIIFRKKIMKQMALGGLKG